MEKNTAAAAVLPCWHGGLACLKFMAAALFLAKGEVS